MDFKWFARRASITVLLSIVAFSFGLIFERATGEDWGLPRGISEVLVTAIVVGMLTATGGGFYGDELNDILIFPNRPRWEAFLLDMALTLTIILLAAIAFFVIAGTSV